jgi:hypothetical protein
MARMHFSAARRPPVAPQQILPYRDGETLMLDMACFGGSRVRVAATGNNPNLHAYEQQREYWYSGDLSALPRLLRGDALSMLVGSEACEDAVIDRYAHGFDLACNWSEPPPVEGWQPGTYDPAPDTTPYLFWMPDPDLPAAWMGMSLVLSRADRLLGVGWHKVNPASKYIWREAPSPGTIVTLYLGGWTSEPWAAFPTENAPSKEDWRYVYQNMLSP